MSDIDSPPQPAAVAGKATLLLVDDEPSVLSALRRLFRLHGYTTLLASGGAEALVLMGEQPVDLVISDMRMPEMDGAEFLEAARAQHPDVVRILLTGYADIGSTIAAINRGEVHRYIAKPWVDHDMLLVVQDALKRHDLERQNASLQALALKQNQDLQDLNRTLEDRVKSRTAELEQMNGMLDQAYEEVKRNFTLTVTMFSGLLEMRGNGIAGHARRVGDLAQRIGVRLGLSAREQQDVHLGALLHDIGKMGFPDAMLGKPVSAYGPDDLARYRHHPLDGEAALMPLDKLHGVAAIVRQHHERFDGRGFPDGLVQDAIHPGARILAVVSDYDDLTHGRLAERIYTPDMAKRAIQDGIGRHYDPKMAAALFAVLADIDAEEMQGVEVLASQLLPQMKLAKDLLTNRGAVLLAAGYVFEARVIAQVAAFAARENLKVVLRILPSSIRPPSAGAARLGKGKAA